jgi:hypothetical protein
MEYIKYKDICGHNRKGIYYNCKNCETKFLGRPNREQKFCCRKCLLEFKNKNKPLCICEVCKIEFNKSFSKQKASKSGYHFCSRKCKEQAQRLGENGIKEIMPKHYGTGIPCYRKVYKELNNIEKLTCERCGYEEFECGVEIHHVNHDHNDNGKENLRAYCAPCHRALHLKLWNEIDLLIEKEKYES